MYVSLYMYVPVSVYVCTTVTTLQAVRLYTYMYRYFGTLCNCFYTRTCTTCMYTNHTIPEITVCRVLRHSFGVVQAQRTSSNLHEPHHHRESKVCRVLLH